MHSKGALINLSAFIEPGTLLFMANLFSDTDLFSDAYLFTRYERGIILLLPTGEEAGRLMEETQQANLLGGGVSNEKCINQLPSPEPEAFFFKLRSMQLLRLGPKQGSNLQNPLVVLLLLSDQRPNPRPRDLCGVFTLNVTWLTTSYLCSAC